MDADQQAGALPEMGAGAWAEGSQEEEEEMRKVVDAAFFNRNSEAGVARYLLSLGFDVSRKYEVKPGPNHGLVWVVQADKKRKARKRE